MPGIQYINTIVFAITLLIGSSCSTNPLLLSHKISGNQPEESLYNHTMANFYSTKNDLSIKLFNSSNQLDLIVETNSYLTLEKIIHLGLGIWLDPEGRSSRKLGINFPLPLNEDNISLFLRETPLNINSLELQKKYDQWFQEMELINFIKGETHITTINNDRDRPCASLSSSPDLLFRYHLTIPLKYIYPYHIPGEESRLSICINSVNDAEQEYYSSLSSKEVVRRKMQTLKAGKNQTQELIENCVTFLLTHPDN